MKSQKNQPGFTLTEIIVSISILTTLATITATQYDGVVAAARDAHRLANTKQVQTALQLYNINTGSYPICNDSGKATAECWETIKTALEPDYMREVPYDPINDQTYTFKYYSDGLKARIEFDTEDETDSSPIIRVSSL